MAKVGGAKQARYNTAWLARARKEKKSYTEKRVREDLQYYQVGLLIEAFAIFLGGYPC